MNPIGHLVLVVDDCFARGRELYALTCCAAGTPLTLVTAFSMTQCSAARPP